MEAQLSSFGWNATNFQSFVERLNGAGQILVAEIDSLFDFVTDCGCHDWCFE